MDQMRPGKNCHPAFDCRTTDSSYVAQITIIQQSPGTSGKQLHERRETIQVLHSFPSHIFLKIQTDVILVIRVWTRRFGHHGRQPPNQQLAIPVQDISTRCKFIQRQRKQPDQTCPSYEALDQCDLPAACQHILTFFPRASLRACMVGINSGTFWISSRMTGSGYLRKKASGSCLASV